MDNFDISKLLEDLKNISKQRPRIRRKLFKFVRDYYPSSKYQDFILEHRMSFNYLSDYSDGRLLEICEGICDSLPKALKLECGGKSIEYKEPVF